MADLGGMFGQGLRRGATSGIKGLRDTERAEAKAKVAKAKAEVLAKAKVFKQNMTTVSKFASVWQFKEGEVKNLDDPKVKGRIINELTLMFSDLSEGGKIGPRVKALINVFADQELVEAQARAATFISSAGKGGFSLRTAINIANIGKPGELSAYFESTVGKKAMEVGIKAKQATTKLAGIRGEDIEATRPGRIESTKATTSLAKTREADLLETQPGRIAQTTARTGQAQAATQRSLTATKLDKAKLSGQFALTEGIAKTASDMVNQARIASGSAKVKLQAIGTLRAAVHSKKFPTGPFGRGRYFISGALELMGVDPEQFPVLGKPATAEVIEASGSLLAIQMAKGLKGKIQNKQLLNMFIKATPGLTKSEEGNIIISDILERSAILDQLKSKAFQDLIIDGTATPKNIFAALRKVEKDYAILDPAIIDRIKRVSKVPKAPPTEKGATFVQYDDAAGSIAGSPGAPLFVRPDGSIFKVIDDGK